METVVTIIQGNAPFEVIEELMDAMRNLMVVLGKDPDDLVFRIWRFDPS